MVPATLQVDGNMGLDANDEYMYFRVQGPETAELSPGQTLLPAFGPRFRQATSGLRSMNLKTGEIKFIVNVGFGIGHVQSNPWMPGEIVFCWETGGKAPQRTWIINADCTVLRPLYPEAPYEWITHEASSARTKPSSPSSVTARSRAPRRNRIGESPAPSSILPASAS